MKEGKGFRPSQEDLWHLVYMHPNLWDSLSHRKAGQAWELGELYKGELKGWRPKGRPRGHSTTFHFHITSLSLSPTLEGSLPPYFLTFSHQPNTMYISPISIQPTPWVKGENWESIQGEEACMIRTTQPFMLTIFTFTNTWLHEWRLKRAIDLSVLTWLGKGRIVKSMY